MRGRDRHELLSRAGVPSGTELRGPALATSVIDAIQRGDALDVLLDRLRARQARRVELEQQVGGCALGRRSCGWPEP
jgi:hypothetical protein